MTSSAAVRLADDPIRQRVGRPRVTVVEDLEGERVLAGDQGHQLLVREELELGLGHARHLTVIYLTASHAHGYERITQTDHGARR